MIAGSEVRVRQQSGFRCDPQAAHLLGRQHRDLGQLPSRGLVVDVGVDQIKLPVWKHQAVHAGVNLGACALPDHLVDVLQMKCRRAPGAAQHAVDITLAQQHGTNERQAPAHFDFGGLLRDTPALHDCKVGLPEVAVAVVVLGVHHVVVLTNLQSQTETVDTLLDDRWASDQRGARKAFVNRHLGGSQHTLLLAFSVGDALALGTLGHREDGLHRGARCIDEGLQLVSVSVQVCDRARRHA